MNENELRVPINKNVSFELSARSSNVFVLACKELDIEFLDQVTPDSAVVLLERIKRFHGSGKKTIAEISGRFENLAAWKDEITRWYWGHEDFQGLTRFTEKIELLLESGRPVSSEDVRLLVKKIRKLHPK